jgi:pilus assembly protein CpaD
MMIKMRTMTIGAALLLPALSIAGCAGTQNRGLESVHQPVVSQTRYVFDVATSGDGLAPGEQPRLAGWMASLRLGYGDTVAVEDAGPYGTGVRDAVAVETERYGLLLSGDLPPSETPPQPGTARIVVTRMTARVPGCPDYSRVRSPEFESNTSSNQGCAINSNIAAMVASPGDLVRGQTARAITDQATANRAIDIYRKATPTGNGGIALAGQSTGRGSK